MYTTIQMISTNTISISNNTCWSFISNYTQRIKFSNNTWQGWGASVGAGAGCFWLLGAGAGARAGAA